MRKKKKDMTNLAKLRDRRGISQKIVGEEIGITQQNLSRYEKDPLCIPADMLIHLSDYYNVTSDYILGLTDQRGAFQGQRRLTEGEEILALYESLEPRKKKMIKELMIEIKEW